MWNCEFLKKYESVLLKLFFERRDAGRYDNYVLTDCMVLKPFFTAAYFVWVRLRNFVTHMHDHIFIH